LYCILKKALKQTFVLHTQKNTSFVLCTQKSTQKVGKKGGKKGSKKRRQNSWQKICQKSTLPYTQHTWLIIRKNTS